MPDRVIRAVPGMSKPIICTMPRLNNRAAGRVLGRRDRVAGTMVSLNNRLVGAPPGPNNIVRAVPGVRHRVVGTR